MQPFYYSWTRQDSAVDFPVESADRDEFVLKNGRRVYDFISTSFQANFGHSNETILNSLAKQLSSMPIASPKSTFDLKTSVSHRLNQMIDRGPGKIFYTVSGAESVENALKIARQITGRKIVAARAKSYHGATLGALSVTGDWRNGPHMTFDEGTIRIPEHDDDPDLSKTKNIIETTGSNQVAAIVLETISGTNGMSMPPPSWFKGIKELCIEFGAMLIIDEVLVGFGRCGSDFAFHEYGIEPDMVCLSKAISGGYVPFGAVWTSPEIASHYESEVFCCGLTNYGHPLGLAALDAVLNLLEDDSFRSQMTGLEKIFESEMRGLAERKNVIELRIKGLMAAVYFGHDAPTWQQGFDAGVHIFGKENYCILAPPYISMPQRLQQAIQTFETLLP